MGPNKRKVKKPVFFNPADATNTIYMKTSIAKNKNSYLPSDTYKKDNVGYICTKKQYVNKLFSSYIKKIDSSCLVLDGKKACTSSILLKNPNVVLIDVPNYSDAYDSLKKIEGIDAYPVSLYDFVTHTRSKYNGIYLDTCGWFLSTKNQKRDLRASLNVILNRSLLKKHGTIGMTVSNRADPSQAIKAKEFMIGENFRLLDEIKYGNMCTMFFKRKQACVHKMNMKIVEDQMIMCDVCNEIQKSHSITKHCDKCDYDICSVCYNMRKHR